MPKPKLNIAAIRALRTSIEVHDFTRQVAEQVAAAAGPGFEAIRGASINRARYVVVPKTPEAFKANYEDVAVVRALGKI